MPEADSNTNSGISNVRAIGGLLCIFLAGLAIYGGIVNTNLFITIVIILAIVFTSIICIIVVIIIIHHYCFKRNKNQCKDSLSQSSINSINLNETKIQQEIKNQKDLIDQQSSSLVLKKKEHYYKSIH